MRVALVSIGRKRGRGKTKEVDLLADDYLLRAGRYAPVEGRWAETEASFWTEIDSQAGREPTRVLLMDSGGKMLTSEEFARAMGGFRDRGAQRLVVGIGGPDGWTEASRAGADLLVSMGRMTLPHGLARVVAAEQIYRAMTILAGHPYHGGHLA